MPLTGAAVELSAASRPRTVPALVLVVVGLTLLGASELQVPLTLRQLNLGNYSASPFPGALGSVAQVAFRTGAYLGPLLTAVGTYLLLRPIETAATARQPGPWADPVTDLDE